MSLALGTRIGPYLIQARIGAGGMGEVFQARDTRLDRQVAIKVLLPAFATDQERLLRFEREARVVAQLNHPGIIHVYDTGLHEGMPYLVMELLEGKTLRGCLQEGPLLPKKATEIALQMAKGLAAAHEKGLTHRDLKPENIFLTLDNRVKILDFGLAKLRPSQEEELDLTQAGTDPVLETRVGVVVGTVGYMSPEQVGGRPVDPRSDIFALGVILWEMLSGRRPFQRDSAVETMHAILKVDPDSSELGPGLSPTLERTLMRCLQKNPQHRFQSAADLAFDLENNTQTSAAGLSGAIRTRPSRPFPWKKGAGIALVLALLGASLWGGWTLHHQAPPTVQRLSYQNGIIQNARFAGDSQTYVFAHRKGGQPSALYVGRVDGTGVRPLDAPKGSKILAVSSLGEMALLLPGGILARAALAGSAPREILEGVLDADWSPDGQELAVLRSLPSGQKRLEFPIGQTLFQTEGGLPLLEQVRVSPLGDLVAFTHHPGAGQGELCIADRAGRRKVLVQGNPDTLAWAPDGKSIIYTARMLEDRYELRRVSLSGQSRTIYPIMGRLDIQDVSRDGRVLLKQSISKQSLRAHREEDGGERDLAWLQTSTVADLSRDGRRLLFGELHEGSGPGGAYLRDLVGGEPIRLGDGDPLALSPDGKWALVASISPGSNWVLMPTGPGNPRVLPMEGLRGEWGIFLPDGKGLLMGAVGPKGFGYHFLDFSSWKLREWGSEAAEAAIGLVSPDSRRVALGPVQGCLELRSIEGHKLKSLPGLKETDIPVQWHADGRSIFLANTHTLPAQIHRLDLATGRRTLWKEITPPNPEEVLAISYLALSPSGTNYAYSYHRTLATDLYLMDGVF